ncbi:hypothetical protein SZ25_00324 [Candidatus Arcanobacter lacustris]|uniref:DUF3576 domain-containing protein n=1 Tax=Candidatus Arcanibacter lacustris TaxID=1607817 RepID=A0A0F5MPG0_9RICK|nr:hypothetical protein SZ25_00324 [Candidatus Arcanobacter lacustris]
MKKIITATLLVLLSACAGQKVKHEYPLADSEKRRQRMGSIVSDEVGGGISLLSRGKKGDSGSSMVNNVLWQASLSVISFMPLQQSDPVGGVILTDWYADPKATGERFKMNVVISSAELKVDGVKVTVFKQTLSKNGDWVSAIVSEQMARDLEDKIINKAKQIKMSHPIS